MADNITLPATGTQIATDDILGKQYQRVKIIFGPDGTNEGDVSSSNGFPVKEISPRTPANTAAVTSIPASLTSSVLIAENANRKGLIIFNDTSNIIYILFGTGTASSSNFTLKLNSQANMVLANYDFAGACQVVSSSVSGTILVTELT